MQVAVHVLFLFTIAGAVQGSDRNFGIDYERNTFVKDGQPFRYVSGSMHYFRCPRQLWRDRLRKMREAGLNAVSTYVEWSQHEKVPGTYDFTDDLDLETFIKTAEEENLFVILRPGPYICAERDMGGLPPWLLKNPSIQLRTSDPSYTAPVQKWMDYLLNRLSPFYYGNGGPIILVQVENEYGSYGACDTQYLIWLRDLFTRHIQDTAVLFTTDGPSTSYLKCGKIPGVYATIDFGAEMDPQTVFAAQRAYEPQGPLVNSEFYPGWLTHWGEPRAVVLTAPVAETLTKMMKLNANVNFYMFHGGSNFGFTAGANFGKNYMSDITSYDYDAPLTEAGDLTEKYFAIRDVLSQFLDVPNATFPMVSPKGDYGQLSLTRIGSLLSPKVRSILGITTAAAHPRTFEAFGNYYGYVLYETTLPASKKKSNQVLTTSEVNDRGDVLINDERIATLSREEKTNTVDLQAPPQAKLGILVENLGRINYGPYNNDSKGLGNVTLDNHILNDWQMTGFSFDNTDSLFNCTKECIKNKGYNFYAARFILKDTEKNPLDTFLDVSNLKKGLVFINGRNLGRYWSNRGPQLSLYVPGVWLKKPPLVNSILVFDERVGLDGISVRFSKSPVWNSKVLIKVK